MRWAAGQPYVFPPQGPAPRVCCTRSAEAERKDRVVGGMARDASKNKNLREPSTELEFPAGALVSQETTQHYRIRATRLLSSSGAHFFYFLNKFQETESPHHQCPPPSPDPGTSSRECERRGPSEQQRRGLCVCLLSGYGRRIQPPGRLWDDPPQSTRAGFTVGGPQQPMEKLIEHVTNGEMASCIKSVY